MYFMYCVMYVFQIHKQKTIFRIIKVRELKYISKKLINFSYVKKFIKINKQIKLKYLTTFIFSYVEFQCY